MRKSSKASSSHWLQPEGKTSSDKTNAEDDSRDDKEDVKAFDDKS